MATEDPPGGAPKVGMTWEVPDIGLREIAPAEIAALLEAETSLPANEPYSWRAPPYSPNRVCCAIHQTTMYESLALAASVVAVNVNVFVPPSYAVMSEACPANAPLVQIIILPT